MTGHLLREIITRGSRGGPLFPLASQLNDDVTHLQGQRIEDMLGYLADEVRQALARLGGTHAVAAVPTALAQLPAATPGFTGRDDELAVLAGLLDPTGSSAPVVVSAVAGLAGVGKTTLAVQAGHMARQRGWFGGGMLFIDLHGYDTAPVEPRPALDALLRALGVSAEHIPLTEEERAGLYRSVLAQIPEPVLVIADNASSEAQVRPLLPGAGPHKVLVTSRHTLAGLDARLVDITVLDDDEAVGLLHAALQTARPDDDRIAGDQDAAGRLARVCGGLPLALQITAAMLKSDPTLAASELAAELAAQSARLDRLRYDDGSGAGTPSVAAAFELSYRKLDGLTARVFRLLAVCPGPDVCTRAAAELAEMPISQARKMLAALAHAHLIEPARVKAGRWQVHDLVHLYASDLSTAHAEEDGREQARDRLLAYYLRMARAADQHLRALPRTAVPPEFTGRADALDWLDTERPSLVAAVTMAADTGRNQAALRLPLVLADYLAWRRRPDDWLATAAISVNAAQRAGDRVNEGVALDNLGNALRQGRRFEKAIIAHQEDLAICRETGDRHGEGMALTNLGNALRDAGRFEEAIRTHQDAAAIFRAADDRHGEGMTLNNLGNALQDAARFEEAITAHQDSAAISREVGDRHGEGIALGSLGGALRNVDRLREAIVAGRESAAIFRETGDRHGEGMALTNFGDALLQVGQTEEAITAFGKAVIIFRETGDEHNEHIVQGKLDAARTAQQAGG